MKKVLIVFVICVIAVSATFLITNNVLSIQNVVDSFKTFSYKIVDRFEPVYSNDLKVNRLQMDNATYNYDKLDDNQKKMYSAVANAVKNLNPTLDIDNYSPDNIDKISQDAKIVMGAFFADHPEVFYLDLTYKLSVSKSLIYNRIRIDLTYSVKNKQDLDNKLKEIENVMDEYNQNLQGKSDFDKELYIHDKLALDVKYYTEITEIENVPQKYHTIYAAFIEKQAVCDGLAKAMQILLTKNSIENIFVTGNIGGTPHAWNMIKLNNEWYHIDVTSDKYIKETNGTTKTVVHTYFNVTDEYLEKTHSIDNQSSNPKAVSNAYNYYIKTNCYIGPTQDFDVRIKQIVTQQNDKNSLEFATDSFDVPSKLLNVLYDINFNNYKTDGNTVKMKYYNENNTYIVEKK